MEIEQKDVDKLSQLDRIEYKQSYYSIKHYFQHSIILSLIFVCTGLILSSIFQILILYVLGMFVLFYGFSIHNNFMKELDEKYFKVNLKDKKG